MNKPTDQLLARIGHLIQRGARLVFWDGQPSILLGAAEWIEGKGLLIAEAGVLDQSGVHLIEADAIVNGADASDTETDEIDLLTEGGNLVASLYPERGAGVEQPAPTPAWSRFWAQEIQNAKGGE